VSGSPDGIVIIGAGDHGRVVLELLRSLGIEPAGFVEPAARPDDEGRVVDGLAVIGDLRSVLDWRDDASRFVVALGDNRARRDAFERCLALGLEPAHAVHPRATVLGGATVAAGAMVCAGAVVGVGASVGPNTILNTGATVDHDDRIGAHAHIAPGAHLAGRVTVGEGAFIGIGSAVREGCLVGPWAEVAGGAMVVADVPDGGRVGGVPARATMAAEVEQRA
jgi:sugar O-acyltransferase (sialic acid O-acetyltransferase NeuD family)